MIRTERSHCHVHHFLVFESPLWQLHCMTPFPGQLQRHHVSLGPPSPLTPEEKRLPHSALQATSQARDLQVAMASFMFFTYLSNLKPAYEAHRLSVWRSCVAPESRGHYLGRP